ncbi:hypothetical protein LZ30DRAFT_46612 [Colletotrichum cereale]|nr:hypothetical protein LZ30DRAFT_46612 [Colletotrichum cereale]
MYGLPSIAMGHPGRSQQTPLFSVLRCSSHAPKRGPGKRQRSEPTSSEALHAITLVARPSGPPPLSAFPLRPPPPFIHRTAMANLVPCPYHPSRAQAVGREIPSARPSPAQWSRPKKRRKKRRRPTAKSLTDGVAVQSDKGTQEQGPGGEEGEDLT